MLGSPRCGAKTRSGRPCASPAVKGKRRCRMHGCAVGSGAPLGNQNAVKHGYYTKSTQEELRKGREALRAMKKIVADARKSRRS